MTRLARSPPVGGTPLAPPPTPSDVNLHDALLRGEKTTGASRDGASRVFASRVSRRPIAALDAPGDRAPAGAGALHARRRERRRPTFPAPASTGPAAPFPPPAPPPFRARTPFPAPESTPEPLVVSRAHVLAETADELARLEAAAAALLNPRRVVGDADARPAAVLAALRPDVDAGVIPGAGIIDVFQNPCAASAAARD